MRILHVIGSLDQRSGGPLRAVLDLSASAQRFGLHSEVLGFGPLRTPDNPLPSELIHSLPVCWGSAYSYAPSLRRWCRENLGRFDGVMLHGLWTYSNWAVSRECLGAGVPYIYFPHGMLDLWSVRGQGMWKRTKKTIYWCWRERGVVARSRAVFFTTQRELENAKKTFVLPVMHPLIVIPYGMAPAAAGSDFRPSIDVFQAPERKVALFLGRVHPKKRPDLLIRAWQQAMLPAEWRLIIAGPGEPAYLEQLVRLAAECGIAESIQFTGPVAGPDKQYLLRRAAWFLLPSEQENFGIAVLEAAMSGCALAVSDQVYLADEFPKGSEILPLDLDLWARFLRERMTDDAWRELLVQRTTDQLVPIFEVEKVTRGWVTTIESVLSGEMRQVIRAA